MHSKIWPTAPGAIIGYRKNGTPIRLLAGGSGEEGEEGAAGTGQESARDGGTGQQDPGTGSESISQRDVTADTTGESGSTGAGDDKTARTIAAIRDDFKAERAKRQAAEKEVAAIRAALDADKAERTKQMDALAVALGLKSGDEPPDPAKLAEDIAQRDSAIRQSRVELAVLRTAGKHGGNGDALLDSRSFMAKVSGLDPAAGSFADDLADAIRAAVQDGPQYKAVTPQAAGEGQQAGGGDRKPPAPSRSGGEHKAPGGNRQWTLADVEAASASEVAAAIDQGLLADLGYHPRKKSR